MFSACEDSPQGVGVYDAPPGDVRGKLGTVDASKLKISIFNIGNFGGIEKTSSERTKLRAKEIGRTLKNKIFSQNDIYIFTDIIGETNGLKEFNNKIKHNGAKCRPVERGVKRFIVICYHEDIKLVKSKALLGGIFNLNQQDNLPAFGAKLKHKVKINGKLIEHEFFLVVLDYSRRPEVDDKLMQRMEYTEEVAAETSKYNEGLPTIIVGDWRNSSSTNEIHEHHQILRAEFPDMDLFEAAESTVIDTDEESPRVRKYNNIIYSSKVWGKGAVSNLGACNKPSQKDDYRWSISDNCPTMFTLERKL